MPSDRKPNIFSRTSWLKSKDFLTTIFKDNVTENWILKLFFFFELTEWIGDSLPEIAFFFFKKKKNLQGPRGFLGIFLNFLKRKSFFKDLLTENRGFYKVIVTKINIFKCLLNENRWSFKDLITESLNFGFTYDLLAKKY